MAMVPERAMLHLVMTAWQFGYAGNHIILRAALNMGVSKLVFPLYRNIIALFALAPFAYFLEKKDRPPLTTMFLVQFFLLGFVGIEQIHLNRKDGIAKVVGTIASVAGASVITLYKGPTIYAPNSSHLHQSHFLVSLGDAEKNWTLGCIYLIVHCLCWSGWIVVQAPLLKKYPARLSVTSYSCLFSTLQFLVIAASFERDLQAWQVHSDGELFSIFYTGVVASALSFAAQTWVIDRAGPVFVSVYLPVQTLLVAVMASVVLGEEFYLGGVIGAVLIVVGLYLVVWGKNEESKFAKENLAIPSMSKRTSSSKSPLIQPLLCCQCENGDH
uniref:WAT1-related protein n=1 Tax=Quercus lobata TaxID=97700 RepID=A0A7N2LZV0_QUELO